MDVYTVPLGKRPAFWVLLRQENLIQREWGRILNRHTFGQFQFQLQATHRFKGKQV